jgi:hypothetical protein
MPVEPQARSRERDSIPAPGTIANQQMPVEPQARSREAGFNSGPGHQINKAFRKNILKVF